MLASYELYLENHLPNESYADWVQRIGIEDVRRMDAEDVQLQVLEKMTLLSFGIPPAELALGALGDKVYSR